MFPTDTFKAFPLQEVEEILSDTVGSFGYERDRANNLLTSMRYAVYEFSHTQTGFFGLQAEVLEDAELYVLFDEIDWQEFEKTKYRNAKVIMSKIELIGPKNLIKRPKVRPDQSSGRQQASLST